MKINSINNQYLSKNNNLLKGGIKRDVTPSFKAGIVPDAVYDKMSNFYSRVAKTQNFQKFISKFGKSPRTFTHIMIAESIFLSSFYMLNTLRNKKIKKEQKPQMLINDAMTLGVSCAGSYFFDGKIGHLVKKGSEKYFEKHKDFYTQLGHDVQEKLAQNAPKSQLLAKVSEVASASDEKIAEGTKEIGHMMGEHLKNIIGEHGKLKTFQVTQNHISDVTKSVKEAVINNKGNIENATKTVEELVTDVYSKSAAKAEAEKAFKGINKLKVIVIFGIIYRYLGPVVITPIANKLSSKLFEKKNKETENKQAEKTENKK